MKTCKTAPLDLSWTCLSSCQRSIHERQTPSTVNKSWFSLFLYSCHIPRPSKRVVFWRLILQNHQARHPKRSWKNLLVKGKILPFTCGFTVSFQPPATRNGSCWPESSWASTRRQVTRRRGRRERSRRRLKGLGCGFLGFWLWFSRVLVGFSRVLVRFFRGVGLVCVEFDVCWSG